MKRFLLAVSLVACCIAQAAVTTIPANPSANRLFAIHVPGADCVPHPDARATVANNVITMTFDAAAGCGVFPVSDTVATVQAPAGTYEVRLVALLNGVARPTTVIIPALVVRANDFTGLWFDPAAPGWGLHVAQGESGTFFATWFSYSATVTPAWSRAPGAWYFAPSAQAVTSTEASGQLYLARSGSDITPVGTMSLRLPADGQLDVQVTGALFDGATKHLRRLEF